MDNRYITCYESTHKTSTRPTRPPAQQQEPSALDLGLKATRVQCGIANSLSYSAFLLPIHQRENRFQEIFLRIERM